MPSIIRNLDGVKRGADLWMIEPEKIHTLEGFNPRTAENEQDIDDLKAYIRENGIRGLPPIRVVLRQQDIYLVQGHRRLRAVKELISEGLPIVALQAIVEKDANEADLLAAAISENQGKPLTPHEESHAFARLQQYGWDVGGIAKKVGKSTTHIYARLQLLEGGPEIQSALSEGTISTTDAVKVVKKAAKTGVSQEELLAHHQATKVDRRKTRHHPQTVENHIRGVLLPLIEQYGFDKVEEVLQAIPEFLEDIPVLTTD